MPGFKTTQDALRKQVREPRRRDVLTGNASDIAMFCFAELYVDVMSVREQVLQFLKQSIISSNQINFRFERC